MSIDDDIPAEFNVTFSGQTQIMSSDVKSVVFNFDEAGTYDIEFSQPIIDETFSTMQKVLYLLFLPLIGIFSMLSVYGEISLSIYKRIHPYVITKRTTLKVEGDTEFNVRYIPSVFDKKQENWSEPCLIFPKSETSDQTTIIKNAKAFDNCYLDFKRTYGALLFDIILIFSIIAILAFDKNDLSGFIAFFSISIFVLSIGITVIMVVKNKVEKGKIKFNQQNDKCVD